MQLMVVDRDSLTLGDKAAVPVLGGSPVAALVLGDRVGVLMQKGSRDSPVVALVLEDRAGSIRVVAGLECNRS